MNISYVGPKQTPPSSSSRTLIKSSEQGSIYRSKDKGLRWTKMASAFFTLGRHQLDTENEEVKKN